MPSLLETEQLRLVRLFIYRMVKRVRRALGGTSQLERICSSAGDDTAPHTAEMTRHFWNEWSSSRKLQPLFTECAHSPNMDVAATVQRIVDLKKLSTNSQVCV